QLQREVNVWKNLHHPHVLQFIGLCTLGPSTYMVSPWMENGDILSYLKLYTEVNPLKLLLQAAKGLEYLHTFKPTVVHGDIKGVSAFANIFVSKSGEATIADFGLSEMTTEGNLANNSTEFYMAGSRRWQAPELVRAETKLQAQRTTASDIFAFGLVAVEVSTPPIRHDS
ncbi:hypothetical protein BOTBODRAFT_110284, partial [Botryobasidium botryosum FD-172 SS1]